MRKRIYALRVIESYCVALLGGILFFVTQLPLPWVLGSMTMMMIWKTFTQRELVSPLILNNGGIAILGIYFGLSFTMETFTTVTPYVIPFLLLTLLLISLSVINSIVITKYIKVDPVTSVFGSIPGGLSEMVIASESLKANTSMVIVFQTVRLLTVVFLVPFIVIHLFAENLEAPLLLVENTQVHTDLWRFILYIPGIFVGWLFRKKLPASFVISPLLFTAVLNISGVNLVTIPQWLLIAAQVTVGMFMGTKITLRDLKLGGKYSGVYFGMTVLLILLSFGMGYLFSLVTPLSVSTSILSFAPGGLIEMVLTAKSIGADSAVVSSLQFIRLLFIIAVVPGVLKWIFQKKQKRISMKLEKVK
jgi:uncharacterized protein